MYYNPNAKMAGGLALALMPTQNFAQMRADRTANLQLLAYEKDALAQQATEKRQALAETQNLLGKVDGAQLLAPDKARLTASVVEPFRQKLEGIIRDEYGGDVVRFNREKGDFYARQFAQDLTRHPQFAQATRNMTNYTLAEDARQKGKLLVGGYEGNLAAFQQGLTDRIDFAGAYDAPKNVWDHFADNYKDGDKYGKFMGIDKNGREIYQPHAVTTQDVYDRLIDSGLSPVEAADFQKRLNYQGGKFWKIDSQSPWDARQQANQERHIRNQEALGWASYGLQKDEANQRRADREADRENKLTIAKLKAQGKNPDGSPTINQQVFNPTELKLVKLKGGKDLSFEGKPVQYTQGVSGKLGDILAQVAGVKSATPPIVYNEAKAAYAPGSIPSQLTNVMGFRGNRLANPDGSPITFQSVDVSKVFYYPEGVGNTPGFNGLVPHIRAVALIEEGDEGDRKVVPREVMLPIPYNELTKAALADGANFYDSDEKRAQQQVGQANVFNPSLDYSPKKGPVNPYLP